MSGASDYILDIVGKGYKLPLRYTLCKVELRNNMSAIDNPEFVAYEIQKLLDKGCVREVSVIPQVVNLLTVALDKGGKRRLVLDRRHVNSNLFKY